MQACYFWISVTFGPCTVYVITGEDFLVIIKHITGPRQRKAALTGFITRAVLLQALFSVHQSGKQAARAYGKTLSFSTIFTF